MGELYIRSQDRERMYKLGTTFDILVYKNFKSFDGENITERHAISIGGTRLKRIGEYGSRERCMEILDEIQAALVGCPAYRFRKDGIGKMNNVMKSDSQITSVYQMPET